MSAHMLLVPRSLVASKKPQQSGTPANAEEDWKSTVEDADAGAPSIA